MNLPDHLLPPSWLWAGHVLFAVALLWAVYFAPWRRLKDSTQLNVWLGACVALMALWSIKTGIKPGLNFHLLGATAFALMFGPQLAIIGLAIVLAAVTMNGMGGLESYSLNALVMGVLPVLTSYGLFRLVDHRLPNHFFVYIFANAFLGAALAMGVTGVAATLLMDLSGAYPAGYLYREYLPYFILMAWSEAMSTGMAMTLMVIYRPHWVCTFDDSRYLKNK